MHAVGLTDLNTSFHKAYDAKIAMVLLSELQQQLQQRQQRHRQQHQRQELQRQ
jgi:hypothetical protein